jgi:hypothetical protein
MDNSFFNPEDKLSERRREEREEQIRKNGQIVSGTILPKGRNDSGKITQYFQILQKREKRAFGSGELIQ